MILTNDKNKINQKQWDDLLQKSSTATFFQSRQCYDFYCSLPFIDSFVFAVLEDDLLKGVIVGYVQKDGGKIKQFMSRRAIITGGALLADDIDEKSLSELLAYCKNQLKHKAIYIEFRNFNDYSKYKSIFQNSGFDYQPHLNFHVDCNNEKQMRDAISESKMRQIKKSLKNGAKIEVATTEKEIEEYYLILENLYSQKVKTSLFPIEFFYDFFRRGCGTFLLVKVDDKIIGGIMCPILDNRTIYELFIAGLDKEYKNYFPSVLATYAAMKFACDNGISRFDFMGAGKPDEHYGVRDFKARFGGALVEYGRFVSVEHPLLYEIGKAAINIIKHC